MVLGLGTRHGIELERRSEVEIAGIFNAEMFG